MSRPSNALSPRFSASTVPPSPRPQARPAAILLNTAPRGQLLRTSDARANGPAAAEAHLSPRAGFRRNRHHLAPGATGIAAAARRALVARARSSLRRTLV